MHVQRQLMWYDQSSPKNATTNLYSDIWSLAYNVLIQKEDKSGHEDFCCVFCTTFYNSFTGELMIIYRHAKIQGQSNN